MYTPVKIPSKPDRSCNENKEQLSCNSNKNKDKDVMRKADPRYAASEQVSGGIIFPQFLVQLERHC